MKADTKKSMDCISKAVETMAKFFEEAQLGTNVKFEGEFSIGSATFKSYKTFPSYKEYSCKEVQNTLNELKRQCGLRAIEKVLNHFGVVNNTIASLSLLSTKDLTNLVDKIQKEYDIYPDRRNTNDKFDSNISPVIECLVFTPPKKTLWPNEFGLAGIAGRAIYSSKTERAGKYHHEIFNILTKEANSPKTIYDLSSCSLNTWDFTSTSAPMFSNKLWPLVGIEFLRSKEVETLNSKKLNNMVLLVRETDSKYHINSILVLAWNHTIKSWFKIGHVRASLADRFSSVWPKNKYGENLVVVGKITEIPEAYNGRCEGRNIILETTGEVRYYPLFNSIKDILNIK